MNQSKSKILGVFSILAFILLGFQNCGKLQFKKTDSLMSKAGTSDQNPDEMEDPPIAENEIPDPDGDDKDDDSIACEDRITDLSGKKAVSVNLNVKKLVLALRPSKGILFLEPPQLFRFFELPAPVGTVDILKLRTGIDFKLPAGFEPDPSRLNSAFFILNPTGNNIVWEDASSTEVKTSPLFAIIKKDPFLRIKMHRKNIPTLVANGNYRMQMDPICLNHVVKYKKYGFLKIFGFDAAEGLYLRHSAKKKADLIKLP